MPWGKEAHTLLCVSWQNDQPPRAADPCSGPHKTEVCTLMHQGGVLAGAGSTPPATKWTAHPADSQCPRAPATEGAVTVGSLIGSLIAVSRGRTRLARGIFQGCGWGCSTFKEAVPEVLGPGCEAAHCRFGLVSLSVCAALQLCSVWPFVRVQLKIETCDSNSWFGSH